MDFWTYSCVNWLRTLPYVRAWAERYRDRGLVVVGVHAPEFGFEHDLDNVRRATTELGVGYPVVIDNDFTIWRSFENHYWPALYLVDGEGRVRFHHFGEGAYEESERAIQELLGVDEETVRVDAGGLAEAADWSTLGSPETYVGHARAERRSDAARRRARAQPMGARRRWSVGEEAAVLDEAGGSIAYRFQARDLNLVLAPPPGAAVGFELLLDGRPPGDAHGIDVDADGRGRRRRAADVPARPSARRRRRAHLRDHVPRPGRARVRLHLRLMSDGVPGGPGPRPVTPRARPAPGAARLRDNRAREVP